MTSQPSTPKSHRFSSYSPSAPTRSPQRTRTPKVKPRYDVFNSFAFHKHIPSDSPQSDTSGSASLLEEIDFIRRASKSPSPSQTPRRAHLLSQSVLEISEDEPPSWDPIFAIVQKNSESPVVRGKEKVEIEGGNEDEDD